jgi:ech hydrogenase subunit F
MLGLLLHRLFRNHQPARYPVADATPPAAFRGLPELDVKRCRGHAACAAACPSNALLVDTTASGWVWQLDRARCLACGLCLEACPEQALTNSADFELAVRGRGALLQRWEFMAQTAGRP